MALDPTGAARDGDPYATGSGRHVRAAGIRIWLDEAGPGDGPPLLLVHGLAARGVVWRRVVPALAGHGLRVLVPDLPGHGRSDGKRHRATYSPRFFARVLLDLADALGIDRFSVAGNSLGGVVAARLALAAPERVERLVLVDSAGLSAEGVPWATRLRYLPFVLGALIGAPPSPLWLRLFLQRAVVADPAQAAELADALSRHPALPTAVRRSAAALVGPDGTLAGELSALVPPTLLVWGEGDVQFPVAIAEAAVRRMPAARLVRIAGAGHVPQWEAPEAVASVLLDFLLGERGADAAARSVARSGPAIPASGALRLRSRRSLARRQRRPPVGPPTATR